MIGICQNCGKETFDKWHRNRIKLFCNNGCRGEYHHKENTQNISCEICGKKFNRPNCHIGTNNFCSRKCRNKWQSSLTANKSGRYKGGKVLQQGYMFIKVGYRQYRQENRIKMEEHLNRKLKTTELVHHKDGNRLNNDINNLEIMSRSEHSKLHGKQIK